MPAAVAAEVHARIVRTLVSSARGGQGLGAELDRLLDLFDQVQVCVENRLCDRATAQAFLGGYGRTLWTNFRPHIADQRAFLPGYGAGLERFVATLPTEVTP